MLNAQFWTGALDRALKTAAQTLATLLLAAKGVSMFDLDWQAYLGMTLTATLLSLLTSIGSTTLGDKGTTSALPGGK